MDETVFLTPRWPELTLTSVCLWNYRNGLEKGQHEQKRRHLTEAPASQYEIHLKIFNVQGITFVKWRRYVLKLKENTDHLLPTSSPHTHTHTHTHTQKPHFTNNHILPTITFYQQSHFTNNYISPTITFYQQSHFTNNHISPTITFHQQPHFTNNHILPTITFHHNDHCCI
jgi:hypothetical protein